jgi:hypothetical protein
MNITPRGGHRGGPGAAPLPAPSDCLRSDARRLEDDVDDDLGAATQTRAEGPALAVGAIEDGA